MDITIHSQKLTAALKLKARQFVDDNFSHPTPSDYLTIENAFLCGSAITMAIEAEELDELDEKTDG